MGIVRYGKMENSGDERGEGLSDGHETHTCSMLLNLTSTYMHLTTRQPQESNSVVSTPPRPRSRHGILYYLGGQQTGVETIEMRWEASSLGHICFNGGPKTFWPWADWQC